MCIRDSISGRRFYQRDEISLGFVAKKRFEDHSEESMVVVSAPEDWTLTDVTHRVVGRVHKARTEKNKGCLLYTSRLILWWMGLSLQIKKRDINR